MTTQHRQLAATLLLTLCLGCGADDDVAQGNPQETQNNTSPAPNTSTNNNPDANNNPSANNDPKPNTNNDPGDPGDPGDPKDNNTKPPEVENARVPNPYVGVNFYVSQDYAEKIEESKAKADAKWHAAMDKVAQQHTAVWLDRIGAIAGSAEVKGLKAHLDAALAQLAKDPSKPMLITFVVYDLPNRDCSALASNGELRLEADGMRRYKEEYIDEIARVITADEAYKSLRIVTVIEPDSLPNMVTNLEAFPDCRTAQPAYEEGLAYAVQKLSTIDNVYIYMDMAHSGWLGWDHGDNAAKAYKKVLEMAGGESKITGFATNVSNYSTLRESFNPFNDVNANMSVIVGFYEWNRMIDERTYVEGMRARFPNHSFIIDTGRSGWASKSGAPMDTRTHRGNWCNVRGAGIGERPTVAPAPGIDAYVWIKPPGESDGTSDSSANSPNEEGKRYDAMCGQEPTLRKISGDTVPTDALPGAPHAGRWFHEQFMMLVENAHPPL